MGKTVGTVLKFGAIAAAIAVTGGSLLGLATIGGFTLGQVAIAGALASVVGSLLDPPSIPNFDSEQGQVLRLSKDPAAPRMIFFGKSAAAGTIVYQEAIGDNNEDLYLVIAVAGHEINQFTDFQWAGTSITFVSNNAVGKYANKMFLFDFNGTEAQTVWTTLDSASTKWTSAHRLRGVAYYGLKLVFDAELFSQGLQQIRRVLEGAKVYDPRLDSTQTAIPGSGSQRADDQTTWTFSNNPALCLATYLLGYSQNGTLIFGMGLDPDKIDWVNFATQADICEQSVNIKGGGTEDRFTCNGFINPEGTHHTNIDRILTSMVGTIVPPKDKWRVYAAAATAAVKTRQTEDFLAIKYTRIKKSISDKRNAVRGVFADEDNRFEIRDVPPFINTTFVTEDGGTIEWIDYNTPMTTSNSTAQRNLRIVLNRSRMEKQVAFALNAVGLQDTVMDTINVTHSPYNLSSQKMRIINWALRFAKDGQGQAGFFIEELAQEEDDSIYDWDETTDEQTPIAVESQTRVDKEPVPTNFVAVGTFNAGMTFDDGNGEALVPLIGLQTATARNGDSVTFSPAYAFVPKVEFDANSLTTETTLSGDVAISLVAENLTTTGFTAQILLKEQAGTPTEQVDTGAVVGATFDFEMEKTNTTPSAAWDNNYKFQFDVTVQNLSDTEPGSCVVNCYIKKTGGGGFNLVASRFVSGSIGSDTTVRLNQIATGEITGVTDFAGVQFAVDLDSSTVPGSVVTAFDSVTYELATPPSDADAAPAGVSKITWRAYLA